MLATSCPLFTRVNLDHRLTETVPSNNSMGLHILNPPVSPVICTFPTLLRSAEITALCNELQLSLGAKNSCQACFEVLQHAT